MKKLLRGSELAKGTGVGARGRVGGEGMNEVGGGSGGAGSGLACELRSEVACDLTLRRNENGERRVPAHLSVADDEEGGASRLGRRGS